MHKELPKYEVVPTQLKKYFVKAVKAKNIIVFLADIQIYLTPNFKKNCKKQKKSLYGIFH